MMEARKGNGYLISDKEENPLLAVVDALEKGDGRQIVLSKKTHQVGIFYENYRGDIAWRRITPIRIFFGSNEYHPTACWLLEALDMDKKEFRTFDMSKIREWRNR